MRRMTRNNGMRQVTKVRSQAPDGREKAGLPWGLRYSVVVVPLITAVWLALMLWSPGWISPDVELMAKYVVGFAAGIVIAAAGALVSRAEF